MADLARWIADPDLLREALTHSSYAHEQSQPTPFNERLEFLGDAVLGLVVSDILYREHPDWDEGQLTQTRAVLVREGSLAEAARRLGVGGRLRLGRGELLTGGRTKPSLLADALEALTAAAYLSGGLAAARGLVLEALGPALRAVAAQPRRQDYKTTLAEYLRRDGRGAEYRVLAETGPDHDKRFVVGVYVDQAEWGRGEGRTKKEAEQQAARVALAQIGVTPED
jgi:ribonuclease-3